MKDTIRICSYILLLSISVSLLTGCEKPVDAAQIALDFHTLITKQDVSPLIQDGLDSDELQSAITYMNLSLKENYKIAFTWDDQVLINEEQLNKLSLAYTNALKRLKATAKITSNKSNAECTVQLSTTYIDHHFIDDQAAQKALEIIDMSQYTDHALYLQELSTAYANELIKGYELFSPTDDTHTESFTFKLNNKIWYPADLELFFTTLCTMISSK